MASKPARIWIGTIPYTPEVFTLMEEIYTYYSMISTIDLTQTLSPMPRDNVRLEQQADLNTGNWLFTSENHNDFPQSQRSLEVDATGSPLVPTQQTITYGKMTPLFQTPDLNMDLNGLTEIALKIGPPLKTTLKLDGWTISRLTSSFDATANSNESLVTIWNLLLSNERFLFSGELLEAESLVEHGKKQVFKRTQKILGLNFGMATEVKNMLLSTNSVVGLTSHTFSDGSTDILLSLKSKEAQLPLARKLFG